MKDKINNNWPAIRLSLFHWWLFGTLMLIVSGWLLMREIRSLRQDKAELTNDMVRMRHNLELIESQMGSGQVILRLGEGME